MARTSGSPRLGAGSNFWKFLDMSSLTSMMAAKLPAPGHAINAEVSWQTYQRAVHDTARHLAVVTMAQVSGQRVLAAISEAGSFLPQQHATRAKRNTRERCHGRCTSLYKHRPRCSAVAQHAT